MPSAHDADTETTPLFRRSSSPSPSTPENDSSDSMPSSPQPSYLKYLHDSSILGFSAVLAQVGLLLSHVVTWKILREKPAGLFTYHPLFQSLAVLVFVEGIVLLQPKPSNSTVKQTGQKLHQAFQGLASLLIIAGASFIIYNKAAHGAAHFTTWHAKIGLTTLCFVLLQALFGAVAVFAPSLVGGPGKAKSLYKYHRMSGYIGFGLLLTTPVLALWSDWVVNNSSQAERNLIGVGYIMVTIAVVLRIETSKLGLKRR
ncbi:cytochrome b561 domain-containing protein [Sporobolomyces salmoneus]|uniref:cytochrome b561 domain-containing protein n=1 Tax=Sporobolomyces salmoneus TaxID=183962 RepID=UPI0031753184